MTVFNRSGGAQDVHDVPHNSLSGSISIVRKEGRLQDTYGTHSSGSGSSSNWRELSCGYPGVSDSMER